MSTNDPNSLLFENEKDAVKKVWVEEMKNLTFTDTDVDVDVDEFFYKTSDRYLEYASKRLLIPSCLGNFRIVQEDIKMEIANG